MGKYIFKYWTSRKYVAQKDACINNNVHTYSVCIFFGVCVFRVFYSAALPYIIPTLAAIAAGSAICSTHMYTRRQFITVVILFSG